MTKREIAIKLLQALFNNDAAYLKKTLTPDYIQHNLEVPTGAKALIETAALWSSGPTKPTAKTLRTIEDGNFVATHSIYNFDGHEIVGLDVFRFEGDKVAEHWDNLIPVQPLNPSGHSQVDGTTEIKHRELTEQNKKIVREFQEALARNDFASAAPALHPNYVQHNPTSGDGLAGVQKAIADSAKRGVHLKFGKVHHVIGEGDFVFVSSEGFINTTPVAIFDIFRVDNKKLVEHWDVIAPVLDKTSPKWVGNTNGKF